jgi:leader peptidase (prepilin peptidase)/N-methyltransferase
MELEIIIGLLYSLIGLFLGSFSNVLVYRLSEHKSLFNPSRSFCPTCGNPIKWYDNIPLLSYIILRGKCRNCKEKISIRYPLIELIGLLIGVGCFLLNYWHPGINDPFTNLAVGFKFIFKWETIVYFFMMILLLNIALVDFKTFEIPFELSIPFILCCIGLYVGKAIEAQDYLLSNILGLVCPLGFFGLVYLIPYLIKKIEVIGLGDVILYTVIGLAFNVYYILIIVCISSLACAVVGIIRMRRGGENVLAFGPYIAMATAICMVLSPLIDQGLASIGLF